jgi:hypothetical protein
LDNSYCRMKVTFFLGQAFLDIFVFTQTLYIGGRPGGGKTLLAYLLGSWLLTNGYVDGVISNIPMNIKSPVVVPVRRQAIILDESWIYLSDRASVFRYAGFVRKDEDYLLLPAVYPVHRLLMRFTCERVFNAFSVGIPGWVYQWRLDRLSMKEKGHFIVFHPELAFGGFDTKAKPRNDGGIVKAISETSGNLLDDMEEDATNDKQTAEALEDVLDGIDEAGKNMDDAVVKIRKIRRRV